MSLSGKILYKVYYRPKSFIARIKKQGGVANSLKIHFSELAMKKASGSLKVICSKTPVYEFHFLTGTKYWYQTAFCAYSLAKVINEPVSFTFHDDGTFNNELLGIINTQFSGCHIKTANETNEALKKYLPASKYPLLNKKRKIYPHIRKLTDIHAGSTGWKMVLDSDMLFFKKPAELLKWLKYPQHPFFLHDPVSSYHYSLNLMEGITGKPVTDNLNVGAIGLQSEAINWDELEDWIKTLEEKEGSSYLLEQALSAMITAGQPIDIANKTNYIVMPDEQEVKQPSAILHHYVAGSKEWYFKTGWKIIKNSDNA